MFNVLVVDDDDSIILFMSRLLKSKFQCEVFQADNGLEALSVVEEKSIDVVFLDITMPVMDGVETLKTLRSKPKFKDLPVIMLTAVADKTIVNKILQLGIISYMLKPLMYDSTYQTVKGIFDTIKETIYGNENIEAEEKEDNRDKLLVVDKDTNFRELVKLHLDDKYLIFDADSGSKGLNLFIKEKPNLIFLSENLAVINEYMLAEKIRTISKTFKNSSPNNVEEIKTLVYLMKKTDTFSYTNKATEQQKTLFDDILVKSSQQGILLRGSKCVIKY